MYICEKILSAEEIIQTCTTIPDLGLVCIDFADLTIRGEANESTMSVLYKTLAAGAKELGCTIILLSQLTRRSGIPKPSDLRWTGLAEALGWMIMMLYDPATDWTVEEDSKEDTLPVADGSAYILVWKVRGGFRKHVDDAPGAICIPFKGKFGWHNSKSRWFTLKKYER
jgi:replicative DNA helicase